MPFPPNLQVDNTLHIDYADAALQFAVFGPPASGAVNDGEPITRSNDAEGTGGINCLSFNSSTTERPIYRVGASSPMQFNSAHSLGEAGDTSCNIWDNAGNNKLGWNDFFLTNTWMFAASFVAEAIDTTAVNPWDNDKLWYESGEYAGVFFKDNGGGNYVVICYLWDTAPRTIEIPILLDTEYTIAFAYDGTNMRASLNNAADQLLPTGPVNAAAAGEFRVYARSGGVQAFHGHNGEFSVHSAYNATRWAELKNFYDRWLGAAPPKDISISFAGVGAMANEPARLLELLTTLAGQGQLDATLERIRQLAMAYQGQGALSVILEDIGAEHDVLARLDGVGNFAATLELIGLMEIQASLAGQGSLLAVLDRIANIQAAFPGTSSFSALVALLGVQELAARWIGQAGLDVTLFKPGTTLHPITNPTLRSRTPRRRLRMI